MPSVNNHRALKRGTHAGTHAGTRRRARGCAGRPIGLRAMLTTGLCGKSWRQKYLPSDGGELYAREHSADRKLTYCRFSYRARRSDYRSSRHRIPLGLINTYKLERTGGTTKYWLRRPRRAYRLRKRREKVCERYLRIDRLIYIRKKKKKEKELSLHREIISFALNRRYIIFGRNSTIRFVDAEISVVVFFVSLYETQSREPFR